MSMTAQAGMSSTKPHLRARWCHTSPVQVNVNGNRPSKTMNTIFDEGEKGTRRSPPTPCYWLDTTYPDRVSAILKDLASQHIKYFRASPDRAPGRTQFQGVENLKEELRNSKMEEDDSGTQEMRSNAFSRDAVSMRDAHMCVMATLNKNNNGNTKEGRKGQCQERAKPRSRHGYSSKRPAKFCCPVETHHGDLDTNHSKYGANKTWNSGLSDTVPKQDGNMRFRDQVVGWKHHKDQPQGERIFVKKAHVGAEGVATASFRSVSDASVQPDPGKTDGPSLERLLWEVSRFNSISDIPQGLQDRLLQRLCKPLLSGGYKEEKSLWANLFNTPVPHLCKISSSSLVPRAVTGTSISQQGKRKEFVSAVKECNNLPERGTRRQGPRPCRKKMSSSAHPDNFLCDDDLIEDLCFKGCSSKERSGTSINSLWDDDFVHEHYILSPPRATLGQDHHSDYGMTSLSTLDHDVYKLASHDPFPSQCVFRRVYGPSFRASSEFWHIKIPTLPSDMVDYQVESDGLTDKVVGSGCSGKVYAATLTLSPRQSREVAVKELFVNMESRKYIVNETRISLYLEPTGFVPICYGLVKGVKGRYIIVLELFGSGQTLRAIINTKKSLPKIHWLHIACQLVDGLDKFHDKDVIINDIKPDNILVDLSGTLPKVKYCDMGSASYKTGVTYDEGQDMKNFIYIAPEVCSYAETTKASDIFSLGKVFQNIHSCSKIHTMLVLYNMCSANAPADRPALSRLRRMLQEEYTKEVLSHTEATRGCLDHSETEQEPQGIVKKGADSPGKKGPPRTGNVSLGNDASEGASRNTGEDAAADSHTQRSLPNTIRCVKNTESASDKSDESAVHELSARTQKLSATDAEFSEFQQICDGTKEDGSLPTTTGEAAAITEKQIKLANPAKTGESQQIRCTSFAKESQGKFPEANSDNHSVSSPLATDSTEPLQDHVLSAAKMKEAPANQDWRGPSPSSALQLAVYPNFISPEASVFETPSELTFSDVAYFLGLLIMLAFRLLWTNDVDAL